MTAFTAVATTGIYCRPGCAAPSPRPENVTRFALPASAEAAGYRACRRCRPYRSSAPLAWDAPELVCRAVRMILDGALDRGRTEAELGARLGVSPRHLRRLFAEHVGVTPDGLARSARVHFARRLLDDTDLSILEVALAAGFGSVRQLNRSCLEVFRESPSALRARRRRSDRLAADGGLLLRLPYQGHLDWDALVRYFAARAIPGVESVDGDAYRRTIVAGGDPGVIELLPGDEGHVLLRAHLPHWEELIHVVQRARHIASLDLDVESAAGDLAADPALAPLVAARPGLRVPGTWDPFETGVRAIIGQQVTVAGATTIVGRLVERHGGLVPGLTSLRLSRLFPSPDTLAEATLEGIGLTGSRAAAIRSFARAVAVDEIRLDRSIGLESLVDSIVAVDGLGPWTANYVALRLGERDACPVTDLGLRRALARLAPDGQADVARAAERWRPWRALGATHLWLADGTPAR